jgi:hypothetical protein
MQNLPVWQQQGGPTMNSSSKILLAGAVAVIAIAVSAVPSEAAKKRAKVPATCATLTSCTMAKTNVVHLCGGDGKWQPALLIPTCSGATCPPPCPK